MSIAERKMPANVEQAYLLEEKEANYNTPSVSEDALHHDSQLNAELPEPTKVYKRRWYILGLYSATIFVAFFFFNTIPPIQGPVKLIFQWTDRSILILNTLSYVALIFAALPFGWLTISKGEQGNIPKTIKNSNIIKTLTLIIIIMIIIIIIIIKY